MISKNIEKHLAISLRRKGLSYREIMTQVPVAKSTISIWLKSVGLSTPQITRLTQKRLDAARRGGLAKRFQRLRVEREIRDEAKQEVGEINKQDLWLMGCMLYWAEGSKAKSYSPSVGLQFSNSDFRMVNIFIKWCTICLGVPTEKLIFSIYIHETHKDDRERFRQYWSDQIGLSLVHFDKIYYKRTALRTNRRNLGRDYHGQIYVKVSRSTNLNRKVEAWINEIYNRCGVV